MIDATPPYRPFATVVTLRISTKVMTIADEAKHWDQYTDLIKWARSLRDAGWKLEHVERIDNDVTD